MQVKNRGLQQRTVREKVCLSGIGLHTGAQIRVQLLPAPVDHGITFVRTDCETHPEIRATVRNVVDTTLATTLGVDGAGANGGMVTVSTVEHLLGAAAGLGVDNLRVLVDGPEIPILDGSAAPFVEALCAVGLETQAKAKRYLVIKRSVSVSDGDKQARLEPGRGLHITCALDFDHPLISPQPFSFDFRSDDFCRHLARARTFGFLKDVEALQSRGLARGGKLENAVVIDEYRVLNPEGLRYPDEFARHKVLDAVGDLALFGMPVVGRLFLSRSGHALNSRLVTAVLANRRAYDVVEAAPARSDAAVDDGAGGEDRWWSGASNAEWSTQLA